MTDPTDMIELAETSYDNCGQRAWAVKSGDKVLFYLVRKLGEERWQARTSLGRGYVSGSVSTLFADWIRARTLHEARRRVLRDLAKRLRARAVELGATANMLDRSTR